MARGCHVITYFSTSWCLLACWEESAFFQSPPTGSGWPGHLVQNPEMLWLDRTSGLQSKCLLVQKRKLGAKGALCPSHIHTQDGGSTIQGPPRPAPHAPSCSSACPLLHKSHGVNSPNFRPSGGSWETP